MNYSNKSIPLEDVTSTDVNKAIQRSLTKACARHGLGLYIYAGEDLPEAEKPEEKDISKDKITKKEATLLKSVAEKKNVPVENVCKYYHVAKLEELTNEQYADALQRFNNG